MNSPETSGTAGELQKPENATFAVDTHLFRELGELLVGRDSTALAELIKNAYDADASFVRVNGLRLDDVDSGLVEVEDDGTGITLREFHRGFLTVAARTKEEGDRRSPIYGRRYTGAKGIGRLAAHKLAALLEVTSQPNRRSNDDELSALRAVIDWDAVESHETLDKTGDAITVQRVEEGAALGTTLRLRRLRKAWRDRDRQLFFREAASLTPPALFVKSLPSTVLKEPLLLVAPTVRDVERTSDPGFRVEFAGDFEGGDSPWELLAAEIAWIVELRCDESCTEIAIAPSLKTQRRFPDARFVRDTVDHHAYTGPAFQARLLFRSGKVQLSTLRNFAIANAGVRVYMEGFRVLPYGDVPRDDWLSIAQRYIARSSNILGADEDAPADDDDEAEDRPGLTQIPPQGVYGAVFLTESGAPTLKTLVNREGFVPNESFDALVDELSSAINIFARERAAVTYESRKQRREERERRRLAAYKGAPQAAADVTLEEVELVDQARPSKPRARLFASTRSLSELLEEASYIFRAARERLAADGPRGAEALLGFVEGQLTQLLTQFREDFGEDLALLRTLASIGTQLTIFAHEVRGLVGGVTAVEAGLERIKGSGALRRGSAESRRLNTLLTSVDTIRRSLERQTAYLADTVSLDARRRRSAQRLYDVFDRSIALLRDVLDRDHIEVINELSKTHRTPPMFRAELQAIFTNLLTNAIKAASSGARIWAHDDLQLDIGERLAFAIENTGRAVNIGASERWFQPFQSTSSRPDALLGQGIGLGLPITRSILDQYNGSIRFVRPSPGYATSVRVSFSG